MADDYDKIAELVRNHYSLPDALNQIAQDKTAPAGSITASMIDTSSLTPIVQSQRTDDGAVATGTTLIPSDDTIPQNTEGDEYLTVSITPKNASNKLIVEAQLLITHSLSTRPLLTMALFRDSGTDALTAITKRLSAGFNEATILTISWEVTAGSTTTTTFKIRAGSDLSGTATVNGIAAARYLGGVMNSFIKVTEIMQ